MFAFPFLRSRFVLVFLSFVFISLWGISAMAQSVKQDRNKIVVDGKARFSVLAQGCIRIEYASDGVFMDEPSLFAVNRDAATMDFTLQTDSGAIIIDTGVISLTYTPDGSPLSDKNLSADISKDGFTAAWKPGMANTGNLGGTIRTVDGVKGPVDLGEGLLSRDGWYLLDDSRRHIFTEDWVAFRPETGATDWYLFGYGRDYLFALRAMTAVAGPVPLPRKYSLGAWYSRYWPYSSKDYHDIIDEYKSHGFPLDVIVLDMDWHKDGWTGWSINRKLLPDAEELLDWFHAQGLFVTFNVHPADGVRPHEDMYADFMLAMGKDPVKDEPILYDAGNKKYLDTLFKYTHEPLEKMGVDFWWLDWQQYPYTRGIPELTNLWWLNDYYTKFTARNGLRGQSFSRWAGWGDHRHPIHFSGDSDTGWPMLAFEVPFTSTAGDIGCFFWSHDIGGHMGARNEESYTRWVQFGATTAALRSHSTRSAEQDRRPWKYPEWGENSMRIAFHLRSEIFPYIYTSARQSARDSIPLNRAMYIAHSKDGRAYQNPQQYYFGDNLLAAPIVAPGVGPKKVGTQVVWFPEDVWYNWFTGERYEGDSEVVVAADIDEFPLYARGGAPIPMQPYTGRMSTTPLSTLVVRAFPGKDGQSRSYTLYEDDGVTDKYKDGAFAETELKYSRKGDEITVSVGAARGVFDGQVRERGYIIELPGTQKAASATVDGKAVDVEYDAAARVNQIKIPERAVTKPVEVRVTAADADFAAVANEAALKRLKGAIGEKAVGKTDIRTAVASYAAEYPASDTLDTLLAIAGVGLRRKETSLYLYQGDAKAVYYARPGALDGDTLHFEAEDRFGTESKVVEQTDLSTAAPVAADVDSVFKLDPLSEPPEFGVRSTRVLKAQFTIAGRKFSLEQMTQNIPSYLTKWNVAGPFPYDRSKEITEQIFGPELKLPIDTKAKYPGVVGGKSGNWRHAETDEKGVVDLNKHFFLAQDDRVAYAVTYIYSKELQKATFVVNSDDRAEMWLNGTKIISKSGGRGIDTETDVANVELKPGFNEVLLKVSQFNFDWKFKVSVGADQPLKQSFKKKEK